MKRLYFTLCLFLTLCGSSLLQAQDCLTLEAAHTQALTGTSTCVEITAHQHESVMGMQFSLRWDTDVLTFKEVSSFGLPNLTNANFGTPSVTGIAGNLNFLWIAADGNYPLNLSDNQVLFSLCFDVIGQPGTRSLVDFDDQIALEFITGTPTDFGLQAATLISGSVSVGNTPVNAPDIQPTLCPQANNCSEVPPAGIQTETSGGTLPYAYTWTGPDEFTASTPNLDEIVPGNYRVVVDDATGLSSSILFTVPGERPLKIVNREVIQPEDCENPTGDIRFEIAGGSGAYEYQWSDGDDSAKRTDLPPGIYGLTVTDMLLGCSVYDNFTIYNSGDIRVTSALITPVSCGTTNTGAIRLEVADDTGTLSISWSNGANGSEISGLTAGTYVATITDGNNCSIEWSATIGTSSDLEFTGTVGYLDCNENSGYITLEVPGDPADFTYAWSNGASTRDIETLAFGSYRVTVTNTNTGCSSYRNFYVNDEGFITGSTWECTVVDEQTVFAKVSTIVWSGGTPPYTFNWSNGDSMSDDEVGFTTVSLPTTLLVTVTDSKGCVTIPEPITPDCLGNNNTFFSTASSYDCVPDEDGNETLAEITYRVWDGGVPPYTFTWNTGQTATDDKVSSIIAPANAIQSYTVTVTDQFGNVHVSDKIVPICQIDGTPLHLDVGEAAVEASGESVCVPIRAEGFTDMTGLQFSISWDPTQLVADTIISETLPDFGPSSYNLGPFHGQDYEGYAGLLWFDRQAPQGVSLPDSAVLLEICFTTIGDQEMTGVVISNHPVIIEATASTSQVIPVITAAGSVSILGGASRTVWPGDTDNNGLVDHFDLLNIGLAYGAKGYPRPNGNLDWAAQFGAPWNKTTPNTQVDYRHIDTDGNGRINAIDTLALALNYRLFNEHWNGEDGFTQLEDLPEAARTTGTPIYVDTYPVEEGEMPTFDIVLGDEESPESTVYGLAFSIDYDPLAILPGSIHVSFDDSWIGREEQDMLTFYRVDSQGHKIHVALTRTDGVDISGRGAVAQLLVTIEDVIFRSDSYDIPIAIENARLINSRQEAVLVTEQSSLITVGGTTNTIDAALDRQITVYPIPAKDVLFVQAPQLRIEHIELYDLEGRRLQHWTGFQDRLPLAELPQGTYALRLITNQGVAIRRIVIMD